MLFKTLKINWRLSHKCYMYVVSLPKSDTQTPGVRVMGYVMHVNFGHTLYSHSFTAGGVFFITLTFGIRLKRSPLSLPISLSQNLSIILILLSPDSWRFPASDLCNFFWEESSKAQSSRIKFTATSSKATEPISWLLGSPCIVTDGLMWQQRHLYRLAQVRPNPLILLSWSLL